MSDIVNNLNQIRQQIAQAEKKREPSLESVTLLAVSKTKSVNDIQEAIDAGHWAFGENYVQEGVDKIIHFKQTEVAERIQWHFIGPLQSNKSKGVAEHFDWIHTVDSVKLITRLASQRPKDLLPLNVLIQVNISHEISKSGVVLEAVDGLVQEVIKHERLHFRGLMAIPAPLAIEPTELERQAHLSTLKVLANKFSELKARYPDEKIDTLSMGMSGDLEIAIEAGSTLVRVGSAIFGSRL